MMRGVWVGLALAVVGCESPGGGPGPARAVDPAALYGQMCARCHGVDGKGIAELRQAMPTLKDLTDVSVRSQRNEVLEQVIMAGRNQMPPFGGMLSPPKIQAVLGHVRRLGQASAGAK